MAVTAIDHVQLAMPAGREAAAQTFYEGLLGIPRVEKPARLAGRGGCWFETATVKVHLGVDANFVSATKAHPGLVVSDLDEMIEGFHNANVSVVEDEIGAGEAFEGGRRVYVEDPFGNRIELIEAPLA